jgi:hypothetical protein
MCGFLPTISYKGFLFEWHNYCGPMELEKLDDENIGEYYEPTNEPSTDEFYEAAVEWRNLPEDERDKYRVE